MVGAADSQKADAGAPQNGLFINKEVEQGQAAVPNCKLMLELKDGHFRYWVRHNIISPRDPKLPFTGEYTVEGNTVVLNNTEISSVDPIRFSVKVIDGAVALWPEFPGDMPEDRKRALARQEVLRRTELPAEEVWAHGVSASKESAPGKPAAKYVRGDALPTSAAASSGIPEKTGSTGILAPDGSVDAQQKITLAETELSALQLAINAFEEDNGRYPSEAEGLDALVKSPVGAAGWRGPYLKRRIVKDPWEHPFIYRCPGQHNPKGYDLSSSGPNGTVGDTDDLTNWRH